MAIIYSYPIAVPTKEDKLVITQAFNPGEDDPDNFNPTKSATISSIVDLVNTGLVPGTGTVTSVGITMPSAFTVGNGSPVTSAGVINITGSGASTQYIDGTGSLQLSPNQLLNTTSSVTFNSITGNGANITNIDKYTTSYIDTNIYTKTQADALFSSGFVKAITLTDSPTANGLYSCTQSGTYTNFGGEVVSLSNQVVSIAVSGFGTGSVTFSQIVTPTGIIIDSTPTSGSTNPVESGGVLDFYKVGNTQTVKFEKAIGSFVSTPQSPITTNTISVDLTNSTNGAPICIYYKGNVLTKNSFTGATPTFFNGVNVLNELCEIWMIYNNVSNSLSVNINSGFTGTVPRIIIPQEPVYTSQNLIKTNNNYLNNTSNSWANTETSTTAMGSGDFEYSIDLIEASNSDRPMIGLSTSPLVRQFNNTPDWEIAANHNAVFQVWVDGTSDGTLTQSTNATAGSKLVLKRIGSVITLIQRESSGDTTIHTFSTPSGGALSGDVYLHIAQNRQTKSVINPIIKLI